MIETSSSGVSQEDSSPITGLWRRAIRVICRIKGSASPVPIIVAGRENDLAATHSLGVEVGSEGGLDRAAIELHNDTGIDRQASVQSGTQAQSWWPDRYH